MQYQSNWIFGKYEGDAQIEIDKIDFGGASAN